MFADYKLRVLENYKIKKSAGDIAFNLVHASPAKIKAECLAVFDTRFMKKDEKILVSFFGQRENQTDYRHAIKQCEADKFKPLSNFLKSSTRSTDEKNIELLAWLTDYEPRPYKTGTANQFTHSSDKEPSVTKENPTEPLLIKTRTINLTKISMISLFSVLLTAVSYFGWHHSAAGITSPKLPATGQEECMFWAGDHYQPVLCSQKIENTTVYALDDEKVARLKKINRPDTITRKGIGHVWYVKIRGKIEFYTAEGYHPIYTSRKLRPMSLYIYSKYIISN
jgi:hypothetical protein